MRASSLALEMAKENKHFIAVIEIWYWDKEDLV
jgi:hypothetical protein